MPETLLTPSSIKLYGRIMTSIQLVRNMNAGPSHNNFLQQQLNAEDARLARIYGFTFEETYYPLPKPAIFVVHGDGHKLGSWDGPSSTVDQSGVAARDWDFSQVPDPNNPDLVYWEYEKGDFSLRLDTEAGPLEDILLAAALRAGADMTDPTGLGGRSGAHLSGAHLAGAHLSGAHLRNR